MLLCGFDSDTVWGQCCCVVRTVMLCGEDRDSVRWQCCCVVRTVILCGDNASFFENTIVSKKLLSH